MRDVGALLDVPGDRLGCPRASGGQPEVAGCPTGGLLTTVPLACDYAVERAGACLPSGGPPAGYQHPVVSCCPPHRVHQYRSIFDIALLLPTLSPCSVSCTSSHYPSISLTWYQVVLYLPAFRMMSVLSENISGSPSASPRH